MKKENNQADKKVIHRKKSSAPKVSHPRRVVQSTKTVVANKVLSKVEAKLKAGQAAGFIQTVGRRKSAIARLRLYTRGSGNITVNTKDYRQYFPYFVWQEKITEALPLVGLDKAVDISVKVVGGGLSAQAEAVRLALARALVLHNNDWRPTLRKMGWLTRDPREKERKKPGLKRARRGPQWAKR